jgi:hypothetical protein
MTYGSTQARVWQRHGLLYEGQPGAALVFVGYKISVSEFGGGGQQDSPELTARRQ